MKLEPNNAYLIAEEDEITIVIPKTAPTLNLKRFRSTSTVTLKSYDSPMCGS